MRNAKRHNVCVKVTVFVEVDPDEINLMNNWSDYDDDMQRASVIARENIFALFANTSRQGFDHADTEVVEVKEVKLT